MSSLVVEDGEQSNLMVSLGMAGNLVRRGCNRPD